MAFERIQKEAHRINEAKVTVLYDRFTTRFQIICDDQVVYSKLLLFLPFRQADIAINNQEYTLKICWFILWQAKLTKNNKIEVRELLFRRRRQSITFFIYAVIVGCVKIGIGFMA